MESVLILVSMVTGTASFIALIHPLPRLWLPTRKRAVVVWIASFFLFFTGAGLSPDPVTEEPSIVATTEVLVESDMEEPEEKPILINARELLKEYKDNPLRANQKYRGKKMLVVGSVGKIDKTLGVGSMVFKGRAFEFEDVRAFFADDDDLLDLNPGDHVSLLCRSVTDGAMGGAILNGCIGKYREGRK